MNYAHKFSVVFFSMLDIYLDVIRAARLAGESRLSEIMLEAAREQVQYCSFSSPELVKRLVDLADLYHCSEKLTEARMLYQKALKMATKLSTRDDWNLARITDGLAQVYLRSAQIDKAEPLSARSLKLFERCLGQEHQLLTTRILRLAWIKTVRKEFDEAARLAQRARLLARPADRLEHGEAAEIAEIETECLSNNSHMQAYNDKPASAKTSCAPVLAVCAE